MQFILNKYFDKSLPVRKLTYNVAAFTLLVTFITTLVNDIIFKAAPIVFVIDGICIIGGVALIIAGDYVKNTHILIRAALLIVGFVLVPCMYLITPTFNCEMLVFCLLCLVFTSILSEGKSLYIIVTVELLIYVTLALISILGVYKQLSFDTSLETYIRVLCAILITAVSCGFLLRYRSAFLIQEMQDNLQGEKEAKELDFSRDMFLVNVSHDIRTPLQAIIGTTEILMSDEDNEEIKKNAYFMSNAGRALLTIVNNMLDFSRLKQKDIVVYDEMYHFSILLNDLINMFSISVANTRVEFITTINPNIPEHLIGDKDKIRTVFTTILDNAVKYTSTGVIELTVDYEKTDVNTALIKVSVADTGIGMTAEVLEKLFNVPEDEIERRELTGEGMGIISCQRILDKMGGSIKARSVLGEGTTFTFSYTQKFQEQEPMVEVHPNGKKVLVFEKNFDCRRSFENVMLYFGIKCVCATTIDEFVEYVEDDSFTHYFVARDNYDLLNDFQKSAINMHRLVILNDALNFNYGQEAACYCVRPINSLNVGAIFNGNDNFSIRNIAHTGDIVCPGVRALVVDDNLINLDVASGILKRYECEVTTVTSGKECLNIMEQEFFDILFLDYMMPEMDGIDTLNFIRQFEDTKKKAIPAVALTANAVSGAREMFMNAGFDEYVSKPIEIEHLENVLKKLLPNHKILWKEDYEERRKHND